ncbi:alpha/beta fold hydrolase [Paracidobacterium acidisoli]|uniref:Alpha/beta fold hydrolase n=1 Tax=Paracidobacterium acidisoli TaxID=2303751 RepID=A0A372ITI9_9BACT|nr:alpha/beta fold hydrolase [Paracidobacterium acidisoli]MBT9329649.1 alpha/beta fold hydrolase [Paracidobacterium acidisoli]
MKRPEQEKIVTMPARTRERLSFHTFPWRFFRRALVIFAVCTAALLVYVWQRPVEVLFRMTAIGLRLKGIHSEYVAIDGRRIHYYTGGAYTGGSGTLVVLVHGLGGRSEDWANLMPQLMRDHRRVYAPDLLGYGQSEKPGDATYSVPEEAHLIEAFMDAQHLDQVDLAGWSMGGWIAMRVALDRPQRIRRLMLYDSAGVRFNLSFDPGLFVPRTAQELTELNALLNPGPVPSIPGFIERDVLRLSRKDGWVIRRSLDAMLTQKDLMDGKLGVLKMPVLIAWGRQDHLIPPAAGEAIHGEIPQSVLEIFDGCGHLAPRQCAARIGPKTVEFLDADPPLSSRTEEIPAH